jgi:hypothetical protein
MSSVAAFIPSVTQLTKDKRIEKVVWWKSKWFLLDSLNGQQSQSQLEGETGCDELAEHSAFLKRPQSIHSNPLLWSTSKNMV